MNYKRFTALTLSMLLLSSNVPVALAAGGEAPLPVINTITDLTPIAENNLGENLEPIQDTQTKENPVQAAPAPTGEKEAAKEEQTKKDLIIHYDFESLKSGTIVNDVSGNGTAAVVRPEGSGVEYKSVNILGEEKTAFVMNGGQPDSKHPYIELPQGVFKNVKDVTISCWVYVDSYTGYARIWDFGSDTTSYMYLLADGGNDGHTGYTAGLTNAGWSKEMGPEKGTNLERGTWKLTTVTFDSSSKTMKMYEDGVQIGDAVKTDADLSVLAESKQNWIGYGQFKNDILDGMVADFRMYNYAMSGDEVAELYNITDEDRVKLDKERLDLGDLSAVTQNLTLPTKGAIGASITWESNNEALITSKGVVTRPQPGQTNGSVTLTATITSGGVSDTKTFQVTVPRLPTEQEIVDGDVKALNLGALNMVTENLKLPKTGALGSVITWQSDHADVISAEGVVTRPTESAVTVKLTATAKKGEKTAVREFTATVLPTSQTLDIVRAEQMRVTTTKGVIPSLPTTVRVTYENGTIGVVRTIWPTNLTGNMFDKEGDQTITGRPVGYDFEIQAVVTTTDEPAIGPKAAAFAFGLNDITLDGTDTIYGQNMERAKEYLKIMDADRMLYNFRATFGQDTKGAKALGGWDEPTGLLRGHSTGHFMSALAIAYASTGDEAYKEKLDYMVDEMRTLQLLSKGSAEQFVTKCTPSSAAQSNWSKDPTVWGEGFISAYSPDQFALLEQYTPYATIWAPYYTMHKLLAGYLDSYIYAGNETGLEIAKDLGNWVYHRLNALKPEQREKMWSMYIAGEYGGMNETLARLFEITGDQKYLDASKMFDNKNFFDGLANNQDSIKGLHANQHIPQIVGAVHEYAATGDAKYYNIAKNFWDMSVTRYSYSIGGVGTGERFPDTPYVQAGKILGNNGRGENCETCAAYNMLKLTMDLYNFSPDDSKYMDYYERTLTNQIAASQSHDTTPNMHNGVTYMLPIDPGQRRGYDSDYGSFTCCNGTGMENHVKYQAAAYAKNEDTLYVNLYMPSTVDWSEKNVKVQQQTQFPSEQSSLTVSGSGEFAMKLRVPYWATAGFTVKVNGETVSTTPTPSSYVTIDRTWSDGDVVTIDMPYTLHLDYTPDELDGKKVASLMYGPLVMVAKDDRAEYTPMNWYELALDGDLTKSVEIVTGAGEADAPHLVAGGLDFYPMYDAYNYRYHAYIKLQPTSSVVDKQNLQALFTEMTGEQAPKEADCTPAQWNAFQLALQDAQTVLENAQATQVQVYDTWEALKLAVSAIRGADVPVQTISVNRSSATLNLKSSDSVQLMAEVTPSNATDKTVTWSSSNESIATVSGDGLVKAKKAGTAVITAKAGDKTAICTVTVISGSNSGGGSSSGGSSTAPGTTTVTKPDGTVVKTTRDTQGNVTVVETKKDGSVTTTQTKKDGQKSVTEKSASGQISAAVTVPKAAEGKTVALSIETLTPGKTTAKAPSVTVSTASGNPVEVTIPIKDASAGVVAVVVGADGKETVIQKSISRADGLTCVVNSGATVKIVDRTKQFSDVAQGNWAQDSITFVTARDIFSGTSETTFTPNAPMTRAMLMTVLARADGADTAGGKNWYDKGQQWAVAKGISDGTNPSGNITREQFVAMLYRYSGSPSVTGAAPAFGDAGKIQSWAVDAVKWAVENKIIAGKSGGLLDPAGTATRAECAAMLQRLLSK